MKKILTLVLLTALLVCCCSCEEPEDKGAEGGEGFVDEKNDELMLSIIDTLENGSNEDLMNLFIPLAREEAIHLDDNAQSLLHFYEGNMTNWENLGGYSDQSTNTGTSVVRSLSKYRITTTDEVYDLYLHRREINTDYRNEEGLYKLRLVVPENEGSQTAYMPYGGIYITESQIASEYASKIIQAIEQNSSEDYMKLFLPEARTKTTSSHFDSMREKSYKGKVVLYWMTKGFGSKDYPTEYKIEDAATEEHFAYIYVQTTEALYKLEMNWLDVRYNNDTPNERYLLSVFLWDADEVPEDYRKLEP